MADQTITGCIDFSTGRAIFDQDDCEYFGCMHFQGIHAGQVAVTIFSTTCDDVFFGCVNLITGRFEVVVPDDCCTFADCTICPDLPGNLFVTTSGIQLCDSGGCTGLHFIEGLGGTFSSDIEAFDEEVLNGRFLVGRTSDCVYTNEIFAGEIYRSRVWPQPRTCTGPTFIDFNGDTIKLELDISGLRLRIWVVDSITSAQSLAYDSGNVSFSNCEILIADIPNILVFPEPNPFCDFRIVGEGSASISES